MRQPGQDRRANAGPSSLVLALLLAVALVASAGGMACAAGESEEELAKKTQNPVADLISVPFQNNFNFGTGPEDKTVWVLNVQPVIPFHLTESWNLITRIIMPVIAQPSLARGVPQVYALGDINPTFFLSPASSRKLIWGVGPTFTLPTASSRVVGSGKWSAGPAAVALTMQGPWVLGALANNQWSFAGWSGSDVNQMLLQPFLNYNFPRGWYLTSSPIMTADWTTGRDNRWTIPAGAGGGKLWRVGKVGLPINTQIQAFYNAIKPDNTADWQLRFQLQFLFPK